MKVAIATYNDHEGRPNFWHWTGTWVPETPRAAKACLKGEGVTIEGDLRLSTWDSVEEFVMGGSK